MWTGKPGVQLKRKRRTWTRPRKVLTHLLLRNQTSVECGRRCFYCVLAVCDRGRVLVTAVRRKQGGSGTKEAQRSVPSERREPRCTPSDTAQQQLQGGLPTPAGDTHLLRKSSRLLPLATLLRGLPFRAGDLGLAMLTVVSSLPCFSPFSDAAECSISSKYFSLRRR